MFKTIYSAQRQRRTNRHRIITGQDTVYRQCMPTTLISYKHGTSGVGGGAAAADLVTCTWIVHGIMNTLIAHYCYIYRHHVMWLYGSCDPGCHTTVRVTVATWIDALWFGIPEDIEIRTVNEAKHIHTNYTQTLCTDLHPGHRPITFAKTFQAALKTHYWILAFIRHARNCLETKVDPLDMWLLTCDNGVNALI